MEITIMENQMEKKMENEMETGIIMEACSRDSMYSHDCLDLWIQKALDAFPPGQSLTSREWKRKWRLLYYIAFGILGLGISAGGLGLVARKRCKDGHRFGAWCSQFHI